MSVLVTYFYQGEDAEAGTKNGFFIPSGGGSAPSSGRPSLTLGEFQRHFPPSANSYGGRLHFRFRAEDAQFGYVWLDVASPGDVLPVYKGQIAAKVLCLDARSAARRIAHLRRKPNQDFGVEGVLAAKASRGASGKAEGSSPRSSSGSSSGSSTAVAQAESKAPSSSSSTATAKSATAAANLMDFGSDDAIPSTPTVVKGPTSDFAGIDLSSASTQPPPAAPPAPKLNREELVAKREAAIQEKVNQALEFKQEVDENQKRESEELDAAKLKHDRNLTDWAFDQSKKKRNVRTLLSTMHKVLWAECTWKAVGLGDIIEPKKVKLQFRKAMLVVHPDRCTTLSAENRFIGKRVFEAINEAYQEFLKTESVE